MSKESLYLKAAAELSKRWKNFTLRDVTPLAFDVSPRRYYRIRYDSDLIPTAILMELAPGDGPLGGGKRKVTQSDAFVEIQWYLQKNNIRVPAIYCDARDDGYLLVEDIGGTSFQERVSEIINTPFDPLLSQDTDHDEVDELMSRAIDLLLELQQLENDGETVAFQRTPTFEQLRAGGEEFIEYICKPLGMTSAEEEVIGEGFDQLSEEILSHPKVFSHYDFIAHNIHILNDDSLVLIDFQDAALESPARDLHALLCDRGMDQLLGSERFERYFDLYKEKCSHGDTINQLYLEYQVCWDSRVSGRFHKLAVVDGREKYRQWIEGTVSRVIRGFEKLSGKFERFGDSLDILLVRIPYARDAIG